MSEHQLTVCKGGLEVKCVSEVVGLNEKEINLILFDERRIAVYGECLKIVSFSKTTGDLFVSGKIVKLNYRDKGEKIIKRLLK